MNNEPKKKNEKPSSNYREPLPEGKVPEGDKAVKKPEDKMYKGQEGSSEYANPAKYKENSEQPVHPGKKEPTDI